MKEFLTETSYCDCSDASIKQVSLRTVKNCTGEKEKAIALFHFVRDNIKYGFDYWNIKASETLAKGYGMCTNKSNLLISMLRSCDIPAGYGILRVNAKEYFGPIMLPFFKSRVSENSVHIYSCVYLNKKWVKCDPSTDLELSRKTSSFNYTTQLVEWDGEHDAMDRIAPHHIIEDRGISPNIDDMLNKKPKKFTRSTLKLANLYLEFLRTHKDVFRSAEEIEQKFMNWVSHKSLSLYMTVMFQKWLSVN